MDRMLFQCAVVVLLARGVVGGPVACTDQGCLEGTAYASALSLVQLKASKSSGENHEESFMSVLAAERSLLRIPRSRHASLISRAIRVVCVGPNEGCKSVDNMTAEEKHLMLTIGWEAELDEEGYTSVCDYGNSAAMRTYIHRVLQKERLRVIDQKTLDTAIRYYDGTCARQSYQALVDELHNGTQPQTCANAWIARANDWTRELGTRMVVDNIRQFEAINSNVGKLTPDRRNKAVDWFIRSIISELHGFIRNDSKLQALVPLVSGVNSTMNYTMLMRRLRSDAAKKHGWLKIPVRKATNRSRVTHAEKWYTRLISDGSVVAYPVSTEEEDQSLEFPRNIGIYAPLSSTGYQAVAGAIDDKEMSLFVRRAIEKEKLILANPDGLRGFVPWYSGSCAAQSWEQLLSELHAAVGRSMECGGSWVDTVDHSLAQAELASASEILAEETRAYEEDEAEDEGFAERTMSVAKTRVEDAKHTITKNTVEAAQIIVDGVQYASAAASEKAEDVKDFVTRTLGKAKDVLAR